MTHTPLTPPLYEASVADWIRHHIWRTLGLSSADLAEICDAVASNRDPQFDALRNARLAMGHLRYEVCGRSPYPVIESCLARLKEYQDSGNREHLVDVANLCEREWIWPSREGTYFEAQDCGGHRSLRS